MPIAEQRKHDLMMTVYIELEKMLTIVSRQCDPDDLIFLKEVEDTIKGSLAEIDPCPSTDLECP